MRAATEFHGITIADNTDFIAVFLAEQSHGAHLSGLVDRQVAVFVAGNGLAHIAVGKTFHLRNLLGSEFLEMREVETQHLVAHKRAFLFHMCSQHLAQSLVQKVGGAVVGLDGPATGDIDSGVEQCLGICRQFVGDVHGHAILALGVADCDAFAGGDVGKRSGVADLAAHLAVEGSAVENKLVELAVFLFHMPVAQDSCLLGNTVVACELLLSFSQNHPVAGLDGCRGTGTLFLLCHFAVEAFLVDGHAVILNDKHSKVQRESVGVVEGERLVAGEHGAALVAGCGAGTFEEPDAVFESAQECVLLLLDYSHDELPLRRQFGICIAHAIYQSVDKAIHEGLFLPQERIRITHGPAQNAADHISGFRISGKLGIGYGEGYRADVVGDYAHSDVGGVVGTIFLVGELGYFVDQRSEYVGIVV